VTSEVWTADKLISLIEQKYPAEQNAYNKVVILKEVADGTGYEQERWIDVVIFQMWKSHGLTRSAFEVKISRRDFLNELSHPEKHQWVKDSFHEFWFVAPENVIQLEELPLGVGFMYPRGDTLCIKRHASRNDKPKLDDELLASFMRSAWKAQRQASLKKEKYVLESSKAYKRAKMYEDACEFFFNSRHVYCMEIPENKEKVLSLLEESTKSSDLKIEREHLLDVLHNFEDNIIDMASDIISLSGRALLAKDELGKYLLSEYGGKDKIALDYLNSINKKKPSERDINRNKLAVQIRQEVKNEKYNNL
jgi:hypothetical protein